MDENETEMEIDDFEASQKYIANFEKTLLSETDNQICDVIIKALKYKKNDDSVIQEISLQINQPEKYKFIIDAQYFHNMYYELTSILSEFGYFLRVYELKKKHRHLFVKKTDRQNIIKQLSSCLIEKFNSFSIVRLEYERNVRRNFEPVDIIYRPTKDIEIEPLCYFSTDIALAYSAYYTRKNKNIRSSKVQSCHYCNHYFVYNPIRFERYVRQSLFTRHYL